VTPSHGPAEIEETANAFDEACAVYARALGAGTVEGLLTGPAIKPVFRRYV
jgi:glutamate-1-semialdehyde 2,1-aminomutase